MKYKNILLIFFSIIFFSSFINASVNTSIVSYWALDGDLLDNQSSNDLSLVSGSLTYTNNSCLRNRCAFFDGSAYISRAGYYPTTGTEWTLAYWIYPTNFTSQIRLMEVQQSVLNGHYLSIFIQTNGSWSTSYWDGSAWRNDVGGNLIINSWNLIAVSYDGTKYNLYKNGNFVRQTTYNPTYRAATGNLAYTFSSASNRYIGLTDEHRYWNVEKNASDMLELYNSNAPPTPPLEIQELLEKTLLTESLSITNISSTNFTTIIKQEITIEKNQTNVHAGITIPLISSSDNTLTCRILGETTNITLGQKERTNTAGLIGNMYLVVPSFPSQNGTFNVSLQCKVDTSWTLVGLITSVTHILINEDGDDIKSQNNIYSIDINSSSFEKVATYNFSVGNSTETEDFIHSLVIDFSSSYIYESDGSLIDMIIGNMNNNCTIYSRYGNDNNIGSVGGNCLFKNVTSNSTHVFNIWARSNTSDGRINISLVTKNFFSNSDNLNTTSLKDINITSSSLTELTRISVDIEATHLGANLYAFAGIPHKSNELRTISNFQLMVTNSVNETSVTIPRTILQDGVVVVQDVFQNLQVGQYNISLLGSCANSNCTITGGDLVAYVTDTFNATTLGFNLSVFDNYDNSSIDNFSVEIESSGTIFSTTNGWINVFSSENQVNLTITSNYNGGYFSTQILNHNQSLDLNVTLNQTLINWNCKEKVSGNDLNCSSPLESFIFNYNVIGNPYSQSINVTGYYENIETFNVTALQNETLNSTFGSSNVSFIPVIILGLGTISNCTYNITSYNHTSFNESLSTTIGNASTLLINGSYNVVIDCDGFAITNQNFSVNDTTENITIELFTTASVNFIFKDADTLTILNGTNVTIQFIGVVSFQNTTDEGSIYLDLITPDTYTITAIVDNYRQTQYILTITDRSTANVTILLQKTNNSELVLISVKDKFSSGPIRLAKVTIQKFVNDSWITDQILNTDFQGRTEGHFVLSTTFYNFLVEFENQTFFGVINSNEDKKAIFAEDVSNGILVEIDTDPNTAISTYQTIYGVSSNLSHTETSNLTGYFRFSFINNNGIDTEGRLIVFEDGILLCNVTATSSTGTLFCYYNVTTGTSSLFQVGGFVNDELQDVIIKFIDGENRFINWGPLGYFLALFLYLFTTFLFLKVPSASIAAGSATLTGLIFLNIIFKGINLSLWITILIITFIIIRIPKKQLA